MRVERDEIGSFNNSVILLLPLPKWAWWLRVGVIMGLGEVCGHLFAGKKPAVASA